MSEALSNVQDQFEHISGSMECPSADPGMTETDLYSYLKEALEGRRWPLEAKGDVVDPDEAGGQGSGEKTAETPEETQ